ncbi:hypothetical protein POM88_044402 [Heracleum sosnowskyi]|uniref:Uncharacterized protein n=1 Tax=Heracleum sosnowskyi TaxID=360622 RepID=A0AAD8M5C1_9APIA|nr:hypothetical protein POM88_044402 [Heracleum sosnowskyi]
MVVSVTALTTSGKPLVAEDLHKTVEACDRVLKLDSEKKKVFDSSQNLSKTHKEKSANRASAELQRYQVFLSFVYRIRELYSAFKATSTFHSQAQLFIGLALQTITKLP